MSEPHVKISGLFGPCALNCPACRANEREKRKQERKARLDGASSSDLLDEVENRIKGYADENAKLRAQLVDFPEKLAAQERSHAARGVQVQRLEKSQAHLQGVVDRARSKLASVLNNPGLEDRPLDEAVHTIRDMVKTLKSKMEAEQFARSHDSRRVRDLRQAVGELVGYPAAGTSGPLDFQLVSLVAKELHDLRGQKADLESTVGEQAEKVAAFTEASTLVFQLVTEATGVRTEGLTMTEAVEKLTQVHRDVVRSRDKALDREMVLTEDLKKARWDLQAYENGERACPEPVTVSNLLASDEHEKHRPYKWVDRDGDAWVWVNVVNQWLCIGYEVDKLENVDVSVMPSSEHGPYVRCERVIN